MIGWSPQSCTEREAVLSREHNQIMPLIPYGVYVQVCDNSLDGDGAKIINCSGTQSFRSARERWWFLAVSKCDSPLVNHDGESHCQMVDFSGTILEFLPHLIAYDSSVLTKRRNWNWIVPETSLFCMIFLGYLERL